MILEHEMTLVGQKASHRCNALFDSGSSYSIVRDDIAREIAVLNPLPDPENWVVETAVAGQTMQEVITEALTMRKWSIKPDSNREEVTHRKTAQRLRI